MLFRPLKKPDTVIPFGVRSCGYYSLLPEWSEDTARRNFAELFWCVSGLLEFEHDGGVEGVGAGDTFYYRQGERHRIRVLETAEYHWLTLDGEGAGSLFDSFNLPRHNTAGECPVRLFQKLEGIIINGSDYGQRSSTSLAFRIVSDACGNRPQLSPQSENFAQRCSEIINANIANPDFNINQLANELNVHRSSLTKRFAQVHKTSPISYLKSMRIQRALYMLRSNHDSINEIAYKCGFSDPGYFCKVIKKTTGCSPMQFRKNAL